MSELVAWLTQILDEDEVMVRAAIKDDGGQDGGFEDSFDLLTKGRDGAGGLAFEPRFGEPAARMIVWNTPRRMLADIAAKRAIIEGYVDSKKWGENGHYDEYASDAAGLETAITILATAYADRPGYREEWKP